jgi:hypothetical protein
MLRGEERDVDTADIQLLDEIEMCSSTECTEGSGPTTGACRSTSSGWPWRETCHSPEEARAVLRCFLVPPEELRRAWKVQRDCSRRGYTTDQVLELDRREPDSELYIRPQQRWSDIVVSFKPGSRSDQEHLDAEIVLRKGSSIPTSRSSPSKASGA